MQEFHFVTCILRLEDVKTYTDSQITTRKKKSNYFYDNVIKNQEIHLAMYPDKSISQL